MSAARGRSYYSVAIHHIDTVPATSGKRNLRVYWLDEHQAMKSALMYPSVNTEAIKPGETADVIRNGNGRILALRRPDLKRYQVEVLVEIEVPGDTEAAFRATDEIMQANWDRTQGGTTIGGPVWHFSMLEGCVAEIELEEDR
jgi:hypothetical protein